MSYILDALRRADAERQHGQVPGLNTLPGVPNRSLTPLQGVPRRWVLALGALAALGMAAALALAAWWWGGNRALGQAPSSAATAVPGVSTGPVAVRSTLPAGVPAATPTATAVPPQPLPVVVTAPPATVSAAPGAAIAGDAGEASPPAPVAVPTTVRVPVVADPAPRALPLAALSNDQRRGLPPLAVGGAVWSDNAAARFVMLNGQLVREGDAVAPGLVLERIEPKSAVLVWQGLRIALPL
jgi:general secretion pathway protein B